MTTTIDALYRRQMRRARWRPWRMAAGITLLIAAGVAHSLLFVILAGAAFPRQEP